MLFLKIIGIGIMALIILGAIETCKEKIQAKKNCARAEAERAQREADGRDWSKVGVESSYRNRGMMEIAYGDICPVCGEKQHRSIGDGNGPHYFPCPTCEERYKQDKKDGIFPPGVSSDNRCYSSTDYYALRLIEYELRTGTIDRVEAQAMQRSLIQSLNDYDAKFKQELQAQEYAKNHPDTSYRNNYIN